MRQDWLPPSGLEKETSLAFLISLQGSFGQVYRIRTGCKPLHYCIDCTPAVDQRYSEVGGDFQGTGREKDYGPLHPVCHSRAGRGSGLWYDYDGQKLGVMADPSAFRLILVMLTLTAGTMYTVWLGDKISEKGIGNGISLLIFVNIVAGMPMGFFNAIRAVGQGGVSVFGLLLYALISIVTIAAVVMITQGERRIPVQYSKRVVGRKMMGGQSTHLPLKVNQSGVIPVIFASSVLTFPLTLAQFIPALAGVNKWFEPGKFGYNIVYVLLIVFSRIFTLQSASIRLRLPTT